VGRQTGAGLPHDTGREIVYTDRRGERQIAKNGRGGRGGRLNQEVGGTIS